MDNRAYINGYIKRAQEAQREFERMSQYQVDNAVRIIAKAVYDNAEFLAQIAVTETGMGNIIDKTAKNRQKAKMIWSHLKGKKSRGVLDTDETTGITRIAKLVGVVAAITPCTNPIVTPMSNAMFALKCGNAIIITPHLSLIHICSCICLSDLHPSASRRSPCILLNDLLLILWSIGIFCFPWRAVRVWTDKR